MFNFGPVFNLFIVGFFWGATNPFLKIGTKGVENVKGRNRLIKTLNEIIFLVSNLKYIIPFLINQIGSLLYYYTLQSSNLTLAVPLTNSLAFVITVITGWILHEKMPDLRTLFGMSLVSFGVGCFIFNSLK